jgi:hypothetical protein
MFEEIDVARVHAGALRDLLEGQAELPPAVGDAVCEVA